MCTIMKKLFSIKFLFLFSYCKASVLAAFCNKCISKSISTSAALHSNCCHNLHHHLTTSMSTTHHTRRTRNSNYFPPLPSSQKSRCFIGASLCSALPTNSNDQEQSPNNNQKSDDNLVMKVLKTVEASEHIERNSDNNNNTNNDNPRSKETQHNDFLDVGREEEKVIPALSPLQELERDVSIVINNLTAGEDTSIYPYIFTNSPLTITRVWNNELWKRSTSRARYIRFLCNMFVSRLFKRILPQLTTCILWSIICVSFITTRVKTASTHYVPLTSLSLVSTLIAFLITLRSNQSLGRLGEARQLWGRLFIVLRDTSQLLVTYVYPKDKKLGLKAVRHLSLFAWLLKDSLRDTNHTEIVETMLGGKVSRSSISNDDYSDDRDINVSNIDLAYLTSQRKKTAATVLRIRQIVADLAARNELHYAPHQQLEKNLNEMNYILGMCERLKGSPIPPVYTSHTTRLLVFYLVFLPLALHGSQVKKLVTVLVTSTVSYAMLGLDEISHVLEQPFRLMPLHDLSRNMMLEVADPFICQPPSFMKLELKTKEEEDLYSCIEEEQQSPSYW